MSRTLDDMHIEEGTPALVAHLEGHGWTCELNERMFYTIAKKPGTGLELILPSPDKLTGRVRVGSKIIPLIGE